jgi:hypothetical protein
MGDLKKWESTVDSTDLKDEQLDAVSGGGDRCGGRG